MKISKSFFFSLKSASKECVIKIIDLNYLLAKRWIDQLIVGSSQIVYTHFVIITMLNKCHWMLEK